MPKHLPPILALLILLLLPASAQAHDHRPEPDTNPLIEAVERAETYWGNAPCNGNIRVMSGPEAPPRVQMDDPLPGSYPAWEWVNFDSPRGEDALSAPPSTYTDCVVHLNPEWWPDWLADDRAFDIFCQLMVHEIGHLEGYPDAGAMPGTIQYINPLSAPLVPECQSYRLVYHAHDKTLIFASRPGREPDRLAFPV